MINIRKSAKAGALGKSEYDLSAIFNQYVIQVQIACFNPCVTGYFNKVPHRVVIFGLCDFSAIIRNLPAFLSSSIFNDSFF